MKKIRTRKQPEERKEELATKAMHLFYQKGYEQTSIQDIADESDVAHGLIYKYFKNKQELYDYAIQKFTTNVSEQYLNLFSNDNFSLEKMLYQTTNLLAVENNRPVLSYLRKPGNELVYKAIMQRTLKDMIPDLVPIVESVGHKEGYHIKDVETFLKFVFYGQIEIMTNIKPDQQDEIKTSILHYIQAILEVSKDREL